MPQPTSTCLILGSHEQLAHMFCLFFIKSKELTSDLVPD